MKKNKEKGRNRRLGPVSPPRWEVRSDGGWVDAEYIHKLKEETAKKLGWKMAEDELIEELDKLGGDRL